MVFKAFAGVSGALKNRKVGMTLAFEEKNMKIVVLDGYVKNPGDLSWERFEQLGEFSVYDRTPSDDLELICERIGNAAAVLISDTCLKRAVFERCPSIRYVGLLSTGYNTVDLQAAGEHGIPVCNIPTYGTDAVSQSTIALLLEICNRVGHHSEAVKAGRWGAQPDFCFWDYPLMELSGKTMGVIGFGRIGQRTAQIAAALGMKILFQDKAERPDLEASHCRQTDLNTLLENSDVIALHCPLFPDTKRMINKDTIARMKDGVILLNCSRGLLVDEQALADALNSGKIFAAGLDVVAKEPIEADNPLLTAKNCIITPHIAWAAKESRARLLEAAADHLEAFLRGVPENIVNEEFLK